MSEQVRREVGELVEGFGPPSPGLASRAVAGLPDRPVRSAPRWAVAAAAVLAIATGALLWTARSIPHHATAPAGVTAPGTTRATDPAGARVAVRAAVTDVQPVLLPAAIGADWRADVTTSADGFRVRYTDPADAARSVTVAVGTPDLSGFGTLTYPAFHGDQRSLYASKGQTLILVWHEPGVYDHVDRFYPGVPYEVTATGFTDADFWQIANSLR